MGDQSWKRSTQGVAVSACYCLTFLFLWRFSLDQWYLPAGLRLACVLLLPSRFWPYVAAGDAAALLVLRAPKAEQYSVQWAYLSPFLFMPLYSLAPLAIRAWLKTTDRISSWLPAITVLIVCWSTTWSMLLNYVLDGPRSEVTLQNFARFSAGDFLGIMMILLPCILWIRRSEWKGTANEIAPNIALATMMVAALFATSMIGDQTGSAVQLMPLVFMVLPVFFLTVMHGWHGAAVGMVLVNLAVALALPRTNAPGAFSEIILVAQVALAALNVGLLFVGDRISKLFQMSTERVMSELNLIQELRNRNSAHSFNNGALQALLRSTELRFRENALLIAAARRDLDSYRHDVVKTLKEEEQYDRAFRAQTTGMEAAKSLDLHQDYLYPLEIESHGLYAALMAPAFLDAWQRRARIYQILRGNQSFISIPLRLSTYRGIIAAMESMCDFRPSDYDVRVRVWRRSGKCGTSVLVLCTPTIEPCEPSERACDALDELRARVMAFDGTLQQRNPYRIRFLMSESAL